jgi:hypothetical protein
MNEYQREWYLRNREKRLEQCKVNYLKNRKRILEKDHENYIKNRDRDLKYSAKWYQNHKTWIIRNCEICGRFCPKKHPRYCEDCNRIVDRIRSNIAHWRKHHSGRD